MERFGGPARGVGSKSSVTDLVSDADRDSEALIRDMLARERPDDGLLAEEGTSASGESGRQWVFDPLGEGEVGAQKIALRTSTRTTITATTPAT